MKYKIMKNDVVEVISGNDTGKKERVLQLMPRSNRVVVEHVNFVTKHVRRSRENPYGARLQKEAPIAISNVMLVCPGCERGSRVKMKTTDDGKKIRLCARCDREIPRPR
ncbi:MAG TPA: 50S ribosomal protein L24 [Planctomycetota bacterium]|nr:50S ribosomal protein L24 [Planctomycetota bacterium]